jgi:uncharacterized membrane protein YgcG
LTAPLRRLKLSLVGAMVIAPPFAPQDPASRVVVPRSVLVVLVFALPVLVVAFGVLMGGAILAQAAQDEGGAIALRWTAAAALMLLIVDLVLLIGALGWNAVSGREGAEVDSDRGGGRNGGRIGGNGGDSAGRSER